MAKLRYCLIFCCFAAVSLSFSFFLSCFYLSQHDRVYIILFYNYIIMSLYMCDIILVNYFNLLSIYCLELILNRYANIDCYQRCSICYIVSFTCHRNSRYFYVIVLCGKTYMPNILVCSSKETNREERGNIFYLPLYVNEIWYVCADKRTRMTTRESRRAASRLSAKSQESKREFDVDTNIDANHSYRGRSRDFVKSRDRRAII